MLSAVLKKEDCAGCQWCCKFYETEKDEYPRFPLDFKNKYPVAFDGSPVKYIEQTDGENRWLVYDLSGQYIHREDCDNENWAYCPFLDSKKGCIVKAEDKSFDCSSWPVRYMRLSDGSKKVCISGDCRLLRDADVSVLKDCVKNEWKEVILSKEKEYPYIVQDFREGYTVLED